MTTELHRKVIAVKRNCPSVIEAAGMRAPSHVLILRANTWEK